MISTNGCWKHHPVSQHAKQLAAASLILFLRSLIHPIHVVSADLKSNTSFTLVPTSLTDGIHVVSVDLKSNTSFIHSCCCHSSSIHSCCCHSSFIHSCCWVTWADNLCVDNDTNEAVSATLHSFTLVAVTLHSFTLVAGRREQTTLCW